MAATLMLRDLAGTLAGLALFPLLLVAPGLVLGWTTNCFAFREGSLPLRLVTSFLLSIGCVPIAAYWLVRFGGFGAAWVALAAVTAAALVVLPKAFPRRELNSFAWLFRQRWFWLIALFWVAGDYLWSMDLVTGDSLAVATMTFDRISHVGVTDAISRTGLPPVNPFYHPGQAVPLYYYYFWYLLCSLIDQMGGALVGPRGAVQASVIWAGLAFFAALLLWLRRLHRGGVIPAGYGVPLALLAVTGLDAVAIAIMVTLHFRWGIGPLPRIALEWWNEQVSAWVQALLWVPHHVTAFAACLAGFYWLREIESGGGRGRDMWRDAAVVGVTFASAAGTSVWVTLTAAVIFAAWALHGLRQRGPRAIAPHAIVAAVSLALASPFGVELIMAGQRQSWPIAFAVRRFFPVTDIGGSLDPSFACGSLCRLAFLPLNYGLELGFYAVAAACYWLVLRPRRPLSEDERLLVVMAVASGLLCTFVRSNLNYNDLGWRGLMFAQFALLVWAVEPARAIWPAATAAGRPPLSRAWRAALGATLVIGVLGTVGPALLLRLKPPEPRLLALRTTYEWIDRTTPASAVIQQNPNVVFDVPSGLYGNRQRVMADKAFGLLYGVDEARGLALRRELGALFDARATLAQVRDAACRYGIDFLVVAAPDPAWRARDSWAWQVPARFETRLSRVVAAADVAKAVGAPCP